MKQAATICDICGRAKQETNHWFVAITDTALMDVSDTAIIFDEAEAADDRGRIGHTEDICGQECLHKRLNQWLDGLQAASRPAPPEEETAP